MADVVPGPSLGKDRAQSYISQTQPLEIAAGGSRLTKAIDR